MAAVDHIHPALRDKVRFILNPRPEPYQGYNPTASVEARHSDTNELMGHLLWDESKVNTVDVEFEPFETPGLPGEGEGDIKGRGLGTALWVRAQQAHEDEPHLYPKPLHSSWRTSEGDNWVTSLYQKGLGPKPPRNEIDD